MPKRYEVKSYSVRMSAPWERTENGQNFKHFALVSCTDATGLNNLRIYFLVDSSVAPNPMCNSNESDSVIFLGKESLGPVIDMLRNEKPIFMHLNKVNPQAQYIVTNEESIGEGE